MHRAGSLASLRDFLGVIGARLGEQTYQLIVSRSKPSPPTIAGFLLSKTVHGIMLALSSFWIYRAVKQDLLRAIALILDPTR